MDETEGVGRYIEKGKLKEEDKTAVVITPAFSYSALEDNSKYL